MPDKKGVKPVLALAEETRDDFICLTTQVSENFVEFGTYFGEDRQICVQRIIKHEENVRG
jgi:hypothetical protein